MKRWWSLLVEAVRGSDRDYTIGPVGPALVMLSVPMVLEMVMESLFAVVDVFYVSRVSRRRRHGRRDRIDADDRLHGRPWPRK